MHLQSTFCTPFFADELASSFELHKNRDKNINFKDLFNKPCQFDFIFFPGFYYKEYCGFEAGNYY